MKNFAKLKILDIVSLTYSTALYNRKTKIKSIKIAIQKAILGVFLGKSVDMIFSCPPKRNFNFPVFYADNINSEESIKKIMELKPEIIFSIYFNQIINKELLRIPNQCSVNIHPSHLPRYRGVGPTFWVLANNEKETGISFHFINPQIDKGDIIKSVKMAILDSDSVHSLYLRSSKIAAEILPEIIEMFVNGNIIRHFQDESQATYFGMPDREGYKKLRKNRRYFITYRDILNRVSSENKFDCV